MRIGESMWRFLKRVLSSRLGQILAVLHLCLLLFDLSRKYVLDFNPNDCTSVSEWHVTGYLIAGRFFHFSHESVLHMLTTLFDLPAIIASSLFTAPLYYFYPSICAYTASWIDAFILLAFASFQWLLIGFGFERLFVRRVERLK